MKKPALIFALLISLAATSCVRHDDAHHDQVNHAGTEIGLEHFLEVELPAADYQVCPIAKSDPVVLRIIGRRDAGEHVRLQLGYTLLEPGEHDLASYLRTADGKSLNHHKPVSVCGASNLPDDFNGVISEPSGTGFLFDSRMKLFWIGVFAWAGLALPWLWARRPKRVASDNPRPAVLPTLDERLLELYRLASHGGLSDDHKVELEQLVMVYWRRRLGLEHLPMDAALGHLRWHVEAGPLLSGLDEWFYRPGLVEDQTAKVLLKPYVEMLLEEKNGSAGNSGRVM